MTVRAYCVAVAAAMAWLHAPPAVAGGSGSSCPIPLDKQLESVRAFEKIHSFVTKEPRCFNCHGGVNPHIDGVGLDPADKTAPPSVTEHGGGARSRNPSKDRGTVTQGCRDCHDDLVPRRGRRQPGEQGYEPVGESLWMTAPSFFSFVGKDAPTLCKQFKRSTGTAEHFTGHMKDDNGGNNFAETAFAGGCGLNPNDFSDKLDRCPKPSISHDTLKKMGQEWIDAMGGEFTGDESCGCVPQLELEIEHHIADRRDTGKARFGEALFASDVRFSVRLEERPKMPNQFLGQLKFPRTYSVSHLYGCAGSAKQEEIFLVNATLDPDAETLDLRVTAGPTRAGEQGFWVCQGERSEVDVTVYSELDQHSPYRMPATGGARQQFTIPRTDGEADETLTVTLKSELESR